MVAWSLKVAQKDTKLLVLLPNVLSTNSPALGIAFKVSDGDLRSRARPAITIEILRQLQVLSQSELEELAAFGPIHTNPQLAEKGGWEDQAILQTQPGREFQDRNHESHPLMDPHEFAVAVHHKLLEFYGPSPMAKPHFLRLMSWYPPSYPKTRMTLTVTVHSKNLKREISYLGSCPWTQKHLKLLKLSRLLVWQTKRVLGSKKILSDITEQQGDLDLSFLSEMSTEEARAWLLQHKGVGPKNCRHCFAILTG